MRCDRARATHLALENGDARLEGVGRGERGAQRARRASGNRRDGQCQAAAPAPVDHGLRNLKHAAVAAAHDHNVKHAQLLRHHNFISESNHPP